MLAKMRPDRLKMHQKAFSGRAPPGPAGGANSAPPDPLAVTKGSYFYGEGREGARSGRGRVRKGREG